MSNKDSHIIQLLKRWISGDIKAPGEQLLDKTAQEDQFLSEALAGLRSSTENDHEQNIARLRKQLNLNEKKSKIAYLSPLRIAAAIALIITAGWFVWTGPSLNNSDGIAMSKEAAPENSATYAPSDDRKSDQAEAITPEEVTTEENLNVRRDSPKQEKVMPPPPPAVLPKKEEAPADYKRPRALENPIIEADEEVVEALSSAKDVGESDVVRNVEEIELAAPPATYSDDVHILESADTQVDIDPMLTTNAGAPAAVQGYRVIEGHITDSEGYPLIGASILENGTARGSVSDTDGYFSIAVREGEGVQLQFSYTGFNTSNIELTADNNYEIILEESLLALDEVVVTSYGVGKSKRTNESDRYASSAPQQEQRPTVEPLNGFSSLKKYIRQNTPDNTNRGKVRLHFIIEADGRPTDISVIHSTNAQLNDLAIQLISSGPKWIVMNGQPPVEVEYLVRIR